MLKDRDALAGQLESGINQLALSVTPAQLDSLLDYLALLHKWNQAYNLTGIRSPAAMVRLNLLDSLCMLPLVDGERILDVGTGAGLPGIPLAICQPRRQFVLLDSNGKKTRFLTQVAVELGLKNIEIVNMRAENFQSDQQIDIVVTRAFSSLRQSLDWFGHLLDEDNFLLAMKGQVPDREIAELPQQFSLQAVHTVDIPGENVSRHVLRIERTGRKK